MLYQALTDFFKDFYKNKETYFTRCLALLAEDICAR